MADLKLTLATGPYDRMRALGTGAVKVEGVELTHIPIVEPPEIFTRMARDHEFDLAEMSLGYYLPARAAGNCSYVAIPVFPSRVFRHGFIFINRNSGITGPKDLSGRRIGVRGYRQSAGVWLRGILRHEYGVSLDGVQWVEGGVNEPRTQDATMDLQPDQNRSIAFAPAGRSLNAMLAAGDIDALIGAQLPAALATSPHVVRLFPDYRQVERAYFEKTGIFPVMHTVVMREALYFEHPWVAESMFKGFEDAKAWANTQMRYLGALRYMLPWLGDDIDEIDELFGGDPFPYGLEANREALGALMQFLADDDLLPAAAKLDDMFAPMVGQAQKGGALTG